MSRYLFAPLLLSLSFASPSALASVDGVSLPLDDRLATIRDIDELRAELATFTAAGDVSSQSAVWKRLAELRPHLGQLKLELAATYAQQDMKSAAYTTLLELHTQGYGFDLGSDKRFTKVATTPAWEYIEDALKTSLEPFGTGEVAATLPKQDLLIESVAWDPTRKSLLVGGLREGAVYQVGKGGALTTLVEADADNGLWAVMDLVVDDERGVLWVASTALPHFKGYRPEQDLGRAGVFKFDLETGKFLKSYLSPSLLGQSFFMTALALAPDGTVYAADGVNNAVYMVREDQLKRVFHAGTLTSIRAMTVSGDGRILYFSDVELGIIGYDLATGKPFDVGVTKQMALAGIDGLVWWNGSLLAVQNGMTPSRVVRLLLAPDGRSFTGLMPLAAGQPEFGAPTQATIAGDQIYFIANSQKNLYDRFGLLKDADQLQAIRIYAADAGFNSDVAGTVPTGQPGVPTDSDGTPPKK